MEKDLRVTEELVIPGAELWFTASRASGPGGQHVNTTSSRVTLSWDVEQTRALDPFRRSRVMRRLRTRITRAGVIQVHVDDERSQHQNRELARQRLAQLVSDALRPRKRRVPTAIPGKERRRRLEGKRRRSAVKQQRRRPVEDG